MEKQNQPKLIEKTKAPNQLDMNPCVIELGKKTDKYIEELMKIKQEKENLKEENEDSDSKE